MKKCLRSWGAGLLLALPLASATAQTAPPVLNPPPTAPPPAPAPAPAPADPVASPSSGPYLLGRVYRIETMQGTTFTGTLVSMSLTALEFDAKELGNIKLDRSQIRLAELQGAVRPGARSDRYDIGNGNRLFFAPTGRGLRRGEGTLQDVDVYLIGVNYGITDNLSVGGYMSAFPGLGLDEQFLVFTPKLSFPVSDNVHFGAGVLYVRVPTFDSRGSGIGAGIGYGALTYGSADNNVTVGVGYGFVSGDVGSTPIVQVGGQVRVSRRVSLISENYIIADAQAGMGGLYGMKLNWRRTSLGLAAAYLYTFPHDEIETYTYYPSSGPPVTTTTTTHVSGGGGSTYFIPVYVDFTFRFGNTGAKAK